MNGYQAIPELLRRRGSTTVFGVLGSSNVGWIGCGVAAGTLRLVKTRHEETAVSAAAGYSRVTGRLGVCSATRGPGFANSLNPLASAVHYHAPLLLIVGESPASRDRTTQNIDQRTLATTLGAGFHHVEDGGELEQRFREAGRRRRARWDAAGPEHRGRRPGERGAPRPGRSARPPTPADRAARPRRGRRSGSRGRRPPADPRRPGRPAGRLPGGPGAAGRGDRGLAGDDHQRQPLLRRAPRRDRPGRSVRARDHEGPAAHVRRRARRGGEPQRLHPGRRARVRRRHDHPGGGGSGPALSGDRRGAPPGRGRGGDRRGTPCGVDGPSSGATAGATLAAHVRAAGRAISAADIGHDPARGVDLRALYAAMDERLPRDRIVVTDAGRTRSTMAALVDAVDAHSWLDSRGYGSVGLGLGYAIGAATAAPERKVVLFTGDVGFMMSSHDLDAIRLNELDLTIVIRNDEQYGAERKYLAQVGLPPDLARQTLPDVPALARALGGDGRVIRHLDDLRDDHLERRGLFILDVRLDPVTDWRPALDRARLPDGPA